MADLLGLGISHWPRLGQPDDIFSIRLRQMLQRPDVPSHAKDPAAWPAEMRREWGDDEGASRAPAHRTALLEGLGIVRRRLDEFAPDAIVVWGDDQYENFREDIVPQFCVLAYEEEAVCRPFGKGPNIWGAASDAEVRVPIAADVGRALVGGLVESDFDVAYAYRPLHYPGLSHAFMNAVLYLDYERAGLPYPIVPFQVNCYGRHVVSHKGSVPMADSGRPYDPPGPSPRRCFDLGRATARVLRASPWRVALLASSSWSHAFLCNKHWQLYPDVAADRRLYDALLAGDYAAWRDTPLADVEDAGQQEVLNWFCLAGAMSELNCRIEWSQFVETYVFNSNKVAAIFSESPAPTGGAEHG